MRRLTYHQKCDHVIGCVMIARKQSSATHFSVADIAKLSGYAVSTKFRNFLYDLVDRGVLAISTHTYHGGVVDRMAMFSLPEDHEENLSLWA